MHRAIPTSVWNPLRELLRHSQPRLICRRRHRIPRTRPLPVVRELPFRSRPDRCSRRGDDHVFEPVEDCDVSLVIAHTDITGAEPAIRGERRPGRVGTVPVLAHDVRPPNLDLASLAWRCLDVVAIDHPYVGEEVWDASGAQFPAGLRRPDNQRTGARLGESRAALARLWVGPGLSTSLGPGRSDLWLTRPT